MRKKHYPEWQRICTRFFGKFDLILDMELNHDFMMINMIESFGKCGGVRGQVIESVCIGIGATIRYSTDYTYTEKRYPQPLEIINAFYGIKSKEDLGMLRSADWEKSCNGSDESHLEVALYKLQHR